MQQKIPVIEQLALRGSYNESPTVMEIDLFITENIFKVKSDKHFSLEIVELREKIRQIPFKRLTRIKDMINANYKLDLIIKEIRDDIRPTRSELSPMEE